jgi:hypothetical protein
MRLTAIRNNGLTYAKELADQATKKYATPVAAAKMVNIRAQWEAQKSSASSSLLIENTPISWPKM